MTSTFFSGRNAAQTSPQPDPTPRSVNAKPPKGHRVVTPNPTLQVARAADTVRKYRDFLTDGTGKTPAPDIHEVVDALGLLSEFAFGAVLIGSGE